MSESVTVFSTIQMFYVVALTTRTCQLSAASGVPVENLETKKLEGFDPCDYS